MANSDFVSSLLLQLSVHVHEAVVSPSWLHEKVRDDEHAMQVDGQSSGLHPCNVLFVGNMCPGAIYCSIDLI